MAEVHSKEAEWEVGATRNPDKAKAWEDKGVEIFNGDIDDKQSLIAAFKDADAIFSTTDSWAPFYNSATPKLLEEGQTINEYCYENELQQGKAGIWLTRPLQSRASILSSSRRCAMLRRGATANTLGSNTSRARRRSSSMFTSSTQSWPENDVCRSTRFIHV